MALAYHQTPGPVNSGNKGASGNEFSATFTSNLPAGSVVAVLTWQYNGTNTCDTVYDDLGNTYVKAFGPIRAGAGVSSASLYGWYCLNSNAGGSPTAGNVKARWSANAQGYMAVTAITGYTGGGLLDQSFSNLTYVSSSFQLTAGTVSTLAQAEQAFWAVAVSSANPTVATGWTSDREPDSFNFESLARRITSSTSAVTPTWDIGSNTPTFVAGGMTFKDYISVPPAGTVTISDADGASATTATVSYSYSASDQSGFEYRLDGGSWASIGASPATITGLSAATEYEIEVRAVNGIGGGTASSPASFGTWNTFTGGAEIGNTPADEGSDPTICGPLTAALSKPLTEVL